MGEMKEDPYQPLFDYLDDALGVIALQTHMYEIIEICKSNNFSDRQTSKTKLGQESGCKEKI